MSLQLLAGRFEPQRLDDDNLSEIVYGTSDVKFIIKSYPIPDKPKQYNHLLVFEKLLRNGFIRLVNFQFEKGEEIVNIQYKSVKIIKNNSELLIEQIIINVISRNFLGDVNVTGDEKYENYSYTVNTTNWLVDKLSWYILSDSSNNKVRETKYHYDGQVYWKNATKGDVTAIENWNNLGANPITRFEYDKFGNVVKTTDPLGRETNYQYGLRDTTFTFVDKITNALDHQTDFKYDLGTGNLLWKKQNGIYTFFYYDVFGKLIKEVQPFDSFELPTKSYNYSFDGTAPESIRISQRTTANKTFDTYFYYDGLGNFIQFKKPSDGNQQIVKNLFYDGMGRVTAESNPYFGSFSTGLTTTQTTDHANYTYDALSRVITVRNPDGNISSVRFDHWNITVYAKGGFYEN